MLGGPKVDFLKIYVCDRRREGGFENFQGSQRYLPPKFYNAYER